MRPLLLAVLALTLAPAPALPQSEPFRVLNQTEQSAHSLFAVRTGRTDWGANLLSRGPLQPGAGFNLRPAENAGCRFDFRMVLSDGREVINRGQDICAEKVVAMQAPLGRPPEAAAPAPSPGAPTPQARGGRASTGTGFVVARDRVLTEVPDAVVTDLLTVRRVAISAKTVARVWATQPSVLNARRWSAQKCRCANSQHKRMAKP